VSGTLNRQAQAMVGIITLSKIVDVHLLDVIRHDFVPEG
jgi:hypothetical protein